MKAAKRDALERAGWQAHLDLRKQIDEAQFGQLPGRKGGKR